MSWSRGSAKVVSDMQAARGEQPPSQYPRPILDRWDAMREVYEILRRYGEPDRRRIMEAVEGQLRDEMAVQAHGGDHE